MMSRIKEIIKRTKLFKLLVSMQKFCSKGWWNFFIHRMVKPFLHKWLIRIIFLIQCIWNKTGIEKHEKQLYVSLTSYPKRIKQAEDTIKSLLIQSEKPDQVILVLSRSEFKDIEVPKNIRKLEKWGLQILWDEKGNIRSYKKLIPVIEYNSDAIIITTDDDAYYDRNLVRDLMREYRKSEQCIQCRWSLAVDYAQEGKMTMNKKWHWNEPTWLQSQIGVGGVLYPPHCLGNDITDRERFKKISPREDDLWFWAMAILNGTRIHQLSDSKGRPDIAEWEPGSQRLSSGNNAGGFDEQLEAILDAFPELREKIYDEWESIRAGGGKKVSYL